MDVQIIRYGIQKNASANVQPTCKSQLADVKVQLDGMIACVNVDVQILQIWMLVMLMERKNGTQKLAHVDVP